MYSSNVPFLLQNLKVPIPDEISVDLGKALLPWNSAFQLLLFEAVPANNRGVASDVQYCVFTGRDRTNSCFGLGACSDRCIGDGKKWPCWQVWSNAECDQSYLRLMH